jgi:hypothetical protein
MPVIPALGHWGLRVPGQPGIHSKTLSKEKGEGGAGEGAQEVECLPSKHEALSSNHCTTTTTTTKKKKVLLGANGLSTVCLWRCRDRQFHPRWRLQIGTNFLEGNSVNIYQKFKSTGQAKQCRSVIPATQEAEIRRIMIWSQLRQKVHNTLSEKALHKKGWWSGSRFRHWVQAPVPQKEKNIYLLIQLSTVWMYHNLFHYSPPGGYLHCVSLLLLQTMMPAGNILVPNTCLNLSVYS